MAEARRQARAQLAGCCESPALEADWLLRHGLGLAAEATLTPAQQTWLAGALRRRRAGEPLAYVLGSAGFWSLELTVTPAVLIPRPETEGLVAWALEDLPAAAEGPLADLGTGSGCIALALAQERPRLTVWAVDRSAEALGVAQANAARLGMEARVRPALGDWWAALPSGLRLAGVVSNPPYVAEGDPHLAALGHEPPAALVAGADGLSALRRLIAEAPAHLRRGAWLRLEHGHDQGAAVRGLLQAAGFADIETRRDLAGHERLSGGWWR
ncbi:MAG TPA: peptide chain release factor N(5)-glutamine methyltransferase [Nevskiaceae bacterium]|nr:peptide chain release factor N(5)-glutamine methyltransferase [Nevskiaceae bacterium]